MKEAASNSDAQIHAADGRSVGDVPFKEHIKAFAGQFQEKLSEFLAQPEGAPTELVQAMRYAALVPGKRLRPFLVVRCCELCGGSRDDAWAAAAAIECVHVFSLIHDDLPAMDDGDLRRGQPACHVRFGEAVAILAGDALLALAFELVATRIVDKAAAVALCGELARATGWTGMIGGQTADVEGENLPVDRNLVNFIHAKKTARLFEAACRMGAMSAGADGRQVELLGRFGQRLGHAFQIADDLLDVTSTESEIGKTAGQDRSAGKQTMPQCVGEEASRQAAEAFASNAVSELKSFGSTAEDLRVLARFAACRNY